MTIDQQRKINAWYENFMQQIAQPPYSFLPHLAGDKGRLYKMVDRQDRNVPGMEPPVGPDEDMFDKRNELYELASQGKLYIFEVGNCMNCSQVRIEPKEKLLYDLQNEVVPQGMPVFPKEQKLGFFKSILNALFGAFEEERLQLKEQYQQELREYTYQSMGVDCDADHAKSMFGQRQENVNKNQETVRNYAPAIIGDLNKQLENKDLLPWQKEMYEAKLVLYTAFCAGQPLTKEQREDILIKAIVGRMGEYKNVTEEKGEITNELQELLHKQPEKAKEIEQIIKNSPFVKEAAARADADIIKYTFTPTALDGAMKTALQSLTTGNEQTQKATENLKQMMKTASAPKKDAPAMCTM